METQTTPAKPSLGKPFLLWILASFVAEITAFILLKILGWELVPPGSQQVLIPALILHGTVVQLGTVGMIFLFLRRAGGPMLADLGFRPHGLSAKSFAVILFGSVFVFFVGMSLCVGYAQLFDWTSPYQIPYEEMRGATALSWLLFIALIPGFCEEIVFRGYLQRALHMRLRPATAIAIASLVFALAHIAPPRMLLAAPLGVWLGVLYWRTGSLWPGIVCHAAINGSWNLLMILVQHSHPSADLTEWRSVDVLVLLGVIAVSLIGFFEALRALRAVAVPR